MIITDDSVQKLIQERQILIDKDLDDSPEADELMGKIKKSILEEWACLTFETIFEALTSIGEAPSLLYDDNGKFAVLCEGYQKAYINGHGSFEFAIFGTGDLNSWKPTVREAIGDYIERLREEIK